MNAETPRPRFSATFWVRLSRNPAWGRRNSRVRFPPLQTNGLYVLGEKRGPVFTLHVRHPQLAPCQLTGDLNHCLGRDTFVALVCRDGRATLYLDSDPVDQQEALLRPSMPEEGGAAGPPSAESFPPEGLAGGAA